ncbi:MAG: transglutaminase-like domain-containing protein [Gemmatimonadales bacterium]|nr:transglutaminase-like domain-containing protein [Gemmatimonadales bacterium]
MIRRIVAVAVLALWVFSLGWLVRRTLGAPEPATATDVALPVAPSSSYYTLRLDSTLVGFASISVDTTVAAVRLTEVIDLRLPEGDSLRRIMLRGETTLTRTLRLLSFAYVRAEQGKRSLVRGNTIGDSALVWQVGYDSTVSRPDTVRLAVQGLQTPASLPLHLMLAARLRPGERRSYQVADPLTRQVVRAQFVVGGDSGFVVADSASYDSTRATWHAERVDSLDGRFLRRHGLGAPSGIWVDQGGVAITGEYLPGLTMERRPFEMAVAEYRDAIARRFPDMPRVSGSIALAAPAPRQVRLAVRLDRVTADSVGWARSGLAGGPQRLRHDTLFVGEAADSTRIVPEPASRDGLVPAGDSAIAALARALAGEEGNPSRTVARLASWTSRQVAPVDDARFADARQAFARRRGDASARALLFVALARAAGVPARPVGGLVLLGNAWRRHAWAEAWLDGRWTPVDPSAGLVPAHAGYVRLLENAPSDPLLVVPLAHRLAPTPIPLEAIP